jgi:hypothetical protein
MNKGKHKPENIPLIDQMLFTAREWVGTNDLEISIDLEL